MATDLHLDVVLPALDVLGQDVEDDELAGEFLRLDARVKDRYPGDGRLVDTDGVDQGDQELGLPGEQALEDVVVLGVEQRGGGRAHRPDGQSAVIPYVRFRPRNSALRCL
jgi:hypothetical protein